MRSKCEHVEAAQDSANFPLADTFRSNLAPRRVRRPSAPISSPIRDSIHCALNHLWFAPALKRGDHLSDSPSTSFQIGSSSGNHLLLKLGMKQITRYAVQEHMTAILTIS